MPKETTPPTVKARDEGGVLVLQLLKPFVEDMTNREFVAAYAPAAVTGGRIVLDLSELDFIDSSHLAAMVVCYKRIVEAGGKVVFCGLKPGVRETFLVTRLDRIFTIAGSRRDAL